MFEKNKKTKESKQVMRFCVLLSISLPFPLPLGVCCPPRPGLAAPSLAVVTYESTKGIKSINIRAGGRRASAAARPLAAAQVHNIKIKHVAINSSLL